MIQSIASYTCAKLFENYVLQCSFFGILIRLIPVKMLLILILFSGIPKPGNTLQTPLNNIFFQRVRSRPFFPDPHPGS